MKEKGGKLAVNKQALTQAAKTAGVVTAGMVAASAGGALARRYVPGVGAFASRGAWQNAVVNLGAGGAVAFALAAPAAKLLKAPARTVKGLMLAGVATAVVAPMAIAQADKALARIGAPPGGVFLSSVPGGVYPSDGGSLGGVLPGGSYAHGSGTLAGYLPAPGGVYPTTIQGIGTMAGLV